MGGNEPDRLVDLGLRSDDRRGDARDYDVRWPGLVHAQHRRNQLVIRWASSGFGEFSVGGHRARGICRKFCPSRRRSALWLVTAVKIAVLARRYVDNRLSELVGSLARAFGERPLGFRLDV